MMVKSKELFGFAVAISLTMTEACNAGCKVNGEINIGGKAVLSTHFSFDKSCESSGVLNLNADDKYKGRLWVEVTKEHYYGPGPCRGRLIEATQVWFKASSDVRTDTFTYKLFPVKSLPKFQEITVEAIIKSINVQSASIVRRSVGSGGALDPDYSAPWSQCV